MYLLNQRLGSRQQDFQIGEGQTSGFFSEKAEPTVPSPTRRIVRRITKIVEPSPDELVTIDPRYRAYPAKPIQLHKDAYAAYIKLKAAAEKAGIPSRILTIISGYRSVEQQRLLWERALRKYRTPQEARKWVAPPGRSAHHTGRAIDFFLGSRNSSSNIPKLLTLPAYHWLVKNAAKFGFAPYKREPWHWEYNPISLPISTSRRVEAKVTTSKRLRPKLSASIGSIKAAEVDVFITPKYESGVFTKATAFCRYG